MGSGRPLSDKGAILRESIGLVLAEAKVPMTNHDIAENQLLAGLGFTRNDVSMALLKMYSSTNRPFPLKRIRVHGGMGSPRWGYYNPEVVHVLEDKPRQQKPAAPEPPPSPPAAPPEFKFDPIELPKELAPEEPTVTVPPGVKAITIRIGGVSIQVELDGLAAAR